MADDIFPASVESPPRPEVNLAELLSGIVSDIQALVAQQFRLTRQEVATNLRLHRTVAAIMAVAGLLGFLAALSFSVSAAHLLHWSTLPAGSDPASLPIWACYASVGGVLSAISIGLVCLGRWKFRAIPPWQNLADELFEEKPTWTTNRT
jgi:hypothetical protein